MGAYDILADYYEYLLTDCDCSKWSQYVCSSVKKALSFNKESCYKGLDAACGTGIITRALKKAGFEVIGADNSPRMLGVAAAESDGLDVTYIQRDLSDFSGLNDLDFITAINDGMNYLSPSKLEKTLQGAFDALKDGGFLMFDISSDYKIKNTLGNNLFSVDDEQKGVTYIWFNTLKGDKLTIDLTFFLMQKDGRYQRKDEKHVMYAHSEEFITEILKKIGFTEIKTAGHLGKKLTATSDRINFTARRANK